MAIAADPNGADLRALAGRPTTSAPSARTDPGTLVWSEALSEDYETARKAFYISVFGYRAEEIGGYESPRYSALYAAGQARSRALVDLHPDFPAGTLAALAPVLRDVRQHRPDHRAGHPDRRDAPRRAAGHRLRPAGRPDRPRRRAGSP